MVKKTATTLKAPMIYVNMVGGQDELIFDGGSFAVNAQGRILAQCRYFEEDLNLVDLETKEGGFRPPPPESERTRQTLVLGIRDFFRKTKNQKAIVGLSGGIDSAVVSCLAADALGPMQLTCVAMPGPFSSPESLKLARELARNLEVEFLEIPIAPIYEQMLKSLTQCLGELTFGTLQENLQARIRGLLLMALSNRESQSLVISTGNKSEYATGYTTLYGDMCGGLAPIGDLLKGEVYELARVYNQQQVLIPEGIINRAPSAELRPDQKDSDSLPPYAELDRAVRRLIENLKPANTKTDRWLVNALMNSEFKRWQAPPILKVSDHAFGRGRRFPVSNRARL